MFISLFFQTIVHRVYFKFQLVCLFEEPATSSCARLLIIIIETSKWILRRKKKTRTHSVHFTLLGAIELLLDLYNSTLTNSAASGLVGSGWFARCVLQELSTLHSHIFNVFLLFFLIRVLKCICVNNLYVFFLFLFTLLSLCRY